MNELVERLQVEQPIEYDIPPHVKQPAAKQLEASVGRDYVHMTFSKTGTTLGVRLDHTHSDTSQANYDAANDYRSPSGTLKVVGELILNYNRVRFHGTIDVATMKGTGKLEYLGEFSPADRQKAS